jgi:hypothetical protein
MKQKRRRTKELQGYCNIPSSPPSTFRDSQKMFTVFIYAVDEQAKREEDDRKKFLASRCVKTVTFCSATSH